MGVKEVFVMARQSESDDISVIISVLILWPWEIGSLGDPARKKTTDEQTDR